MKAEMTIGLTITHRELTLIQYGVQELLSVTKEYDLTRGFDQNAQSECRQINLELINLVEQAKGERQ